jgi:hypothetical protein
VPEEIRMPAPDDRRTQKLDLARRWQESRRSARVFAQEQGVTPWTLYYWREQLVREQRPKAPRRRRPSRRVQLAPVHIMSGAEDGSGAEVEIVLASGDRVRVAASVSADTLRRVVQAVRASC